MSPQVLNTFSAVRDLPNAELAKRERKNGRRIPAGSQMRDDVRMVMATGLARTQIYSNQIVWKVELSSHLVRSISADTLEGTARLQADKVTREFQPFLLGLRLLTLVARWWVADQSKACSWVLLFVGSL